MHWRSLWIIGISLALSALPIQISFGADCTKAKEIYGVAVKLINYEQRAEAFRKAVEICPSYAEAHVNLADAYENLAGMVKGDPKKFNTLLDGAVKHYQEALKLKEDLFPAWLGLGDTYRVMGLYEKSEQAYRRALELKPLAPKALAGLEKIAVIKTHEQQGFRSSKDIVRHFKRVSTDRTLNLMGFESHTEIKDRIRFDNILFNEWSADLTRQEALSQLDEIGKALSSDDFSHCAFVVEGHTDNLGGEDRNTKLSWDRAESVRNYLVKRFNIEEQRIKLQGFGYLRPRVPNDSNENRLKNRRVEILFIDRSTGE